MRIVFKKSFDKSYKKLRESVKEKFKSRKRIFLINPFDSVLNNHALEGKYKGFRSINITGDFRAVYKMINDDTALFVIVDTHSNLYK